jgi:glycosyltransferase involved in cell wall biosynthesis
LINPRLNWFVSQIGAREHYATPRALHARGELQTLYTDAWCRWGAGLLSRGPDAARALAARRHADIPGSRVVAFTFRALLDNFHGACRLTLAADERYREFIRVALEFANRVNRHLRRQSLDPQRHAFFGYSMGCLETLGPLHDCGILTVVDQFDPARVEEDMVIEEAQRWPGWQALPGRIPEDYYDRLTQEWKLANLVQVNSEWSKAALVQQGVPAGKIIVVPLAYEPDAAVPHGRLRSNAERPLTVLWLGSVILRKGIQYLLQAAKRLSSTRIKFIVAGHVGIAERIISEAPASVTFIGRVTRDRTAEVYRSADVFVLSTISDGFAITQLEAMAHGLPVIATPNCARVVDEGVDGLIVPARDAEALAAAIARLDGDRAMLAEMSVKAVVKSRLYSLDNFVRILLEQVNAQRTSTCVASRSGGSAP